MRIWPEKTVDQEFADLAAAGHFGSLNDRQFSYLRSQGLTGGLADMMFQWRSGGVTPDYTFTNNTELQAILALGSAIEGKRIHAVGEVSDPLTISTVSYTVPPIFGTNAGATIQRLTIQDVDNIRFEGARFQAAADWPKVYPEITLLLGSIARTHFVNCKWRGGYGPSLVDYDLAADYPEYERVDNVTTATTTSSRIALTYADTSANVPRDAWIEFFNRGANAVYVAIGDSTVTATLSSTLAPAGQRTRITWNVTTTDRPTHIAVITAAGTSEVNARTEIGLQVYMADGVGTGTPNAELNDVRWIGCEFSDLANPLKAPGDPVGIVVVDKCKFRRTYGDSIAFAGMKDDPAVEMWVTRNTLMPAGAARQEIQEGGDGDARDPHGDFVQIYQKNASSQSVARMYIAGNRYEPAAVRSVVASQGVFLSMPQVSPSHMDLTYVLSNILPYGNLNQIVLGRPAGENLVRNAIIQNNTIVGREDLTGSGMSVYQDATGPYATVIKDNIARLITAGTDVYRDGNALWTSAALGDVFATPADRLDTSLTVDEFITAVAPVSGLSGKGYRADLIDFTASDPRDSIVWENVDPGLRWRTVQDLPLSTTYETEWRRIIGGPSSMSIEALASCEYQVADDSAGTGAGAWTSSAGTVDRLKWVRARRTTSASDLTGVTIGVVLNGQTINMTATTTGPYFTSAADFGFRDPAGSSSLSGASGRLTMELVLYQSTVTGCTLYQHGSQVVTLDQTALGALRISVRDSANTVLANNLASANGVIAANTTNRILFCIDLPNNSAKTWVNGVAVHDATLAANTGALSATGIMNFLQNNSLASRFGGRVYSIKVWKNEVTTDGTIPSATPYFEMPGVAATANASAWKSGAGVAT